MEEKKKGCSEGKHQAEEWTLFCCTGLCVCDKIMTPVFLMLRLYIFGVCPVLTYEAECHTSEYLTADGECCPRCPKGLYILEECTTMKNTVCEVLDGYHCVDHSERECTIAEKHSECKPGQRIKTPGTKTSDTVCEPCPPGFYSPKGVNCSKWTDCSVSNEIEDKEGSSISDVKCKPIERDRPGLIAAFSLLPLLLAILLYLCLAQANRRRTILRSPVEETYPDSGAPYTKRVDDEEPDSPDGT